MQLTIPQHWKLSPILASLSTAGGHLSRTGTAGSGHLAKCGDDCLCDDPAVDYEPECACFNSDFSTASTIPFMQIDITGTPTLQGTPEGCQPAGACNSLAGSYVLPRNSGSCSFLNGGNGFCVHTYACNSGTSSVWYRQEVKFEYIVGPFFTRVTVIFSTRRITGSSFSTTPTACAFPLGNNRTLTFESPAGTYEQWIYRLGGACTTECNESNLRPACPTLPPLITDIQNPPSNRHCSVNDYSVSLSFV